MVKEVLEIEKKFYVEDEAVIPTLLQRLSLKDSSSSQEVDAYFTDIEGQFVKDRTCLRLRYSSNSPKVTIDFKGKSVDSSSLFAKVESNLSLPSAAIPGLFKLFSNVGYYKYSSVDKNRTSYTREEGDLTYTLTVDRLDDIGAFIELELTCPTSSPLAAKIHDVYEEKVTRKISGIRMEEASQPYRDIVAQKIKEKWLKGKKKLIIDIDHLFYTNVSKVDGNGNLSEWEKHVSNVYNNDAQTLQSTPSELVGLNHEIDALNDLARTFKITYLTHQPDKVTPALLEKVGLSKDSFKLVSMSNVSADDGNTLAIISSKVAADKLSNFASKAFKTPVPGVSLPVAGLTFDTFAELGLVCKFASA